MKSESGLGVTAVSSIEELGLGGGLGFVSGIL